MKLSPENQLEFFQKMQDNLAPAGITFDWEFLDGQNIQARHIVTDHGWKILFDRELDIFQRFEMNDAFVITNRVQNYRPCKAFEITYLRVAE